MLDGQCVLPEALHHHRETHYFLAPGCLCSSQSIDENITESIIFMVATGQFAGQWVAACAGRKCKYWGKFFVIQITVEPTLMLKTVLKAHFACEGIPTPRQVIY